MEKIGLCILCRDYNTIWINFLKRFSSNYDIYYFIDNNYIKYPEKEENIHLIQIDNEICYKTNYYKSSSWTNLNDVISWDKALYYFNRVNTRNSHIWFIEEDVFFTNENILLNIDKQYNTADLLCSFHEINATGDIRQGWNHWINVIHRIGTPWAHSLISICRLSRRLLDKIDGYVQDRHLMIIESLFNTLAEHNKFIIQHPVEMRETITYNSVFDISKIDFTKIYHPIKKIEVHSKLREFL